MSNEVFYRHPSSGMTLYFTLETPAGLIWNGTSLVAMAVADWASYDVAITENPSASFRYFGNMPPAPAGKYLIRIYHSIGATPAINDPLLASGEIGWNGTAECSLLNYLSDTYANYRADSTGKTLYAVFELVSSGTIWNGSSLEAFAALNWATYDVPLPESPVSGYRYLAPIPALPATGRYRVTIYDQAGALPAVSDQLVTSGEIMVFAVGTSIRQQILTALAARLATITVANGYRTDLGLNVHEWETVPLDPNESTLRVEYRDEQGTTGWSAVGEHLHTLPVTLRVLHKNNTAGAVLPALRDAMADIYQALNLDVTFGGLAQDTNQEGEIKYDKNQAADTAAGAEVVYMIEYTTEPGTP